MRKINGKISLILIILIIFHIIMGASQMIGITQLSPEWKKFVSYFMVGLLLIHITCGILLTINPINNSKITKARYLNLNKRFWISRVTGVLIIILGGYHIWFFMAKEEQRLNIFGELQLFMSLLLVVSILIHVLLNIRPSFISMGFKKFRIFVKDTGVIMIVVFVIAFFAFIMYYLRWNILWQ